MLNKSGTVIRIVIIDDHDIFIAALRAFLEKDPELIVIGEGHNTDEALRAASEKPDLILLDLRMPKMDGVEFLKKLETKDKDPDLSIIVFSNYDEQKEIDEAFKHGATRYILKAWSSPKELVKVVNETLNPTARDEED